MRRLLKRIPAMQFAYGQYRLRQFRRAYGPDGARLLRGVPAGMPPLDRAHCLSEFHWLVRHRHFPADLIERLLPPGEGDPLQRTFANFTAGYRAEQILAAEWQRAAVISEAVERRLTEYLNRYITYALRTFAVDLEMRSDPGSAEAIRLRRVLGELEGEEGELLDVGCAFVPLAERYARMRGWIGLDLSLPSLAIGRIVQRVPAASLVCGYSENLPFLDGSFDVVVSSEVLEHTPRPRRMIAEMARVLRAGGKAIVSVPMHIVDFQDGRQHRIGPTDSTHRLQFHSLAELKRLFAEHGLALDRLQSDPHYIFTLRRDDSGDQAFRRSGVRAFGPTRNEQEHEQEHEPNTEHQHARTPERPNARTHERRTPERRTPERRTPERLNADDPPFACPDCGDPLAVAETALWCAACEVRFDRREGVPVLLPRRLRPACLDLAV